MVQRLKSNVPTGITAYRDPATGDVAGSYPRQDDAASPEHSETKRLTELQAANAILAQQAADWYALYADRATKERAAIKEITSLREENAELRQMLQNMEAARDAALRLKVERQPELGRIADALCEYNERTDQDAGRYQWLRKHAAAKLRRITQDLTWMQSARGTDGKLNVAHQEIQAMLDEEIDNAIASQAAENKTPNTNSTTDSVG